MAKLFLACLLVGALEFFPATTFAQGADSDEVWSYHFQFTGFEETHGAFAAKYSGLRSLADTLENPLSITATLFFGRRVWDGGAIYFNPELSGGSGFSLTQGVADFPNGEVYRVDNPTPKIFVARAFLRQSFSLGGDQVEKFEPDQNQLGESFSKSRVTVTAGKFSLTDIFDENAYSHDPRTQFMNWGLWSGGAWDYAADTRGYNFGIAAELHQPSWTINAAAVMVPTTANGPIFDFHIDKAYSFNLEFVKPYLLFEKEGALHLIGFLNHANMGNYRTALTDAAFTGAAPNVDSAHSYSSKYGFVISIEQALSASSGLFSRISWNDGHTETWAFTEIDLSFNIGVNCKCNLWQRPDDVLGAAFVVSGLSADHRDYLAAGGYGFIVGDGHLNYAPEQVIETFYNCKLTSSCFLTLDNQLIVNPGYNKDRGPVVNAVGLRIHVAF